jgi:hypothetical protein
MQAIDKVNGTTIISNEYDEINRHIKRLKFRRFLTLPKISVRREADFSFLAQNFRAERRRKF